MQNRKSGFAQPGFPGVWFLPQGFQSLVVHDGLGQSRHLAVNYNGDIYVKLRLDYGRNGNV